MILSCFCVLFLICSINYGTNLYSGGWITQTKGHEQQRRETNNDNNNANTYHRVIECFVVNMKQANRA